MRRLVATEFITLDGIIEAPGQDQHRDGRNAWALQYAGEDQQRYKMEETYASDAMMLGRVTYEIFAAFWPTAPGDEGFADRMNSIPKYVVSSTLKEATWNNTTILRSADDVRKLKERPGGEILIHGSGALVRSLAKESLIDEYRLMVFPVLLGSGDRLFRDAADTKHLALTDSLTFSSGVIVLTYRPADQAPSSKYVEEFAWTQEQMQSWLAVQNADRVLATVMFTDIVDSTGRAATLGDRQWRRLLDRHDEAARAEVERFRGTFVKSTGDGILATFDAPTRALRCAFALDQTLADFGVNIRAAIHTGEIEIRDDDIGGIGVHIAARALAEAGSRQVIVTRTVRDLATGTDLLFHSLGSVGLRGVPGEWELFEAKTN